MTHTNVLSKEKKASTDGLRIGGSNTLDLGRFFSLFGNSLASQLDASFPPLYSGQPDKQREYLCAQLLKQPFPAQARAIQTCAAGLIEHDLRSVILNGMMGTGKTLMAIATAFILAHEKGYRRFLVLSPPHLVYKWRREILDALGGEINGMKVKVILLNGPDAIHKLNRRRHVLPPKDTIEFYVLGRVRMRIGFWWQAAFTMRKVLGDEYEKLLDDPRCKPSVRLKSEEGYLACSNCGTPVLDTDFSGTRGKTEAVPLGVFYRQVREQEVLHTPLCPKRVKCRICAAPLWTTTRRPLDKDLTQEERILKALAKLPTIGPARAKILLQLCGSKRVQEMLEDRFDDLKNLPHPEDPTQFFFTDHAAERMERAFARSNGAFQLSDATYQPSVFIRQYMRRFFDTVIIDEGHEYKELSSAQGQAMGTIASQAKKCLLLTGTLMGGYADDLFYLLWRTAPSLFVRDGLKDPRKALSSAGKEFLKRYGVLEYSFDVLEGSGSDFKTARARQTPVTIRRRPGFSAAGIAHYLLPQTTFIQLDEISAKLPPYKEHLNLIPMSDRQNDVYTEMAQKVISFLSNRLARQDRTFLGKALSILLAQSDTGWIAERITHRDERVVDIPFVWTGDALAPKEQALVELVRKERARNRKVLVYCNLTQKRDLTTRLRAIFQRHGIKAVILRSTVKTDDREEWLDTQIDRGVEVLITNPELVKTGLDLIDYPTIVFLQTGYSVYTVMQAARRSWRIGQTQPVDVHYFGYQETAQQDCLTLMSQKISVAQSVQGELPENGLSALNTSGEEESSQSMQQQLAKEIFKRFSSGSSRTKLKLLTP